MMQEPLTRNVTVLVIGAGPAGLGVAARLGELGVRDVVVLDREPQPGGLPAQCEHAGFGLWTFRRLLRGRAFAERVVRRAERAQVEIRLATTALSITREREALAVSPSGLMHLRAEALVLATGCRERPRSNLLVAGTRPAGVFNTGVVQRLHTFLHVLPGRDIVLVGSDDMGLMAAHTLTRLGARVRAVVEERPYRQGYLGLEWLMLRPARIPLLRGHRVIAIRGAQRVSGVEVARVGRMPLTIPCDTVIFSGEFFPENALAESAGVPLDPETHGPVVDQDWQTDLPGIFACGNLTHAADAADHALEEGEQTAHAVLRYLTRQRAAPSATQLIQPGEGIRAVVPQRLRWYGPRMQPVRLAVRVNPPQWGVRLDAHANGREWGRAFAAAAKPHRSVYVVAAPKEPTEEPLWVRARGIPMAPASAAPENVLEWQAN